MINKRLYKVCAFLFSIYCSTASAELSIHNIENVIEGKFGCEPKFKNNPSGNQLRAFDCDDESNVIRYSSTIYSSGLFFGKNDIEKYLITSINSTVASINSQATTTTQAKIVRRDIINIGAESFAKSQINYAVDGQPVRKFSILTIKNGKFLSWSVYDYPGYSKASADKIFEQNYRYFKTR